MMPGQVSHQPPLSAAHQWLAGPPAEHGGLDYQPGPADVRQHPGEADAGDEHAGAVAGAVADIVTSEGVRARQFSITRLRPGYDEQEVDAFLDEVESELRRLRHDNHELELELARTRRNARGADAALSAHDSPADGEATAGHYPPTGIRALAQHVADQAIAAARRDAAETIAYARHRADQVTQTATQEAGQAIRDATARAESLERDSRERHRQVIGSLGPQRAELQARVDYLSAFERDYRAKLKARLESHLRGAEASAEDSKDIPARAATGRQTASGPGMDDAKPRQATSPTASVSGLPMRRPRSGSHHAAGTSQPGQQ